MAKIEDASLVPTKLDLLERWMGFQRWYTSTGTPSLRRLGGYRLDDPQGSVGIETLIVADESGPRPVVYQVPVTYRDTPLAGGERALIGTLEHSLLGTRYVYDAPHDPVFAEQLLTFLTGVERAQHAEKSATEDPRFTSRPLDADDRRTMIASRVLSGEQSNTSIIIETRSADGRELPIICKVFRVLQHGLNPDVELQTALARSESDLVPAPLGSIDGAWKDPEVEGARAEGPLAFASEFLPGTQDAWRVALDAARRGEDFTDRARALGEATAQIHVALASAMPTRTATDADRTALARSFADRAASAVAEHAALSDVAPQVERIEKHGVEVEWPPMQRIHGDYHLGQVLDVPGRGWVVLDFEGEPLRPMAERVEPDLALRDVAGMLRSFDYVAGTIAAEAQEAASDALSGQPVEGVLPPRPDAQAGRAWAMAAREAFLDGYASAGSDPRDPQTSALLSALELDKALYEVMYEARNRPTWVDIPASAVRTLCADAPDEAPNATAPAEPPHQTAIPEQIDTTTARRSVTQVSEHIDPTVESPVTESTPPSPSQEATSPESPASQARPESQVSPAPQVTTAAEPDGPLAPPAGMTSPELTEPVAALGESDEVGLTTGAADAGTGVDTDSNTAADAGAGVRAEQSEVAKSSSSSDGTTAISTAGVITTPETAAPASTTSTSGALSTPEIGTTDAGAEAADAAVETETAVVLQAEAEADAAGGIEPEAEPEPEAMVPGAMHVHQDEIDLLVRGGHGDPHSILGAHPTGSGTTIRAMRPLAESVVVELPGGVRHEMVHEHEGVWLTHIEGRVSDYRLLVTYAGGPELRQDDPYRFWPTLGEIDLHLIGEGRHEELWKVLGSHIRHYSGGELGEVSGTSFAVWAPNARAVRVVGSFNNWDGKDHPMRALGSSGVWELFIPEVGENATYKYEILARDGYWRAKADPMARATECPPATASVVTQSGYSWSDTDWMAERASHTEPHNQPMSAYEVHIASWRQGLSYVQLAEELVEYVSEMGFTHVQFLPVMEHPYGPSWGYQVTGYYAPTSRFGSPDEFRYLVDELHQAGIGVILDWVPAHFPKDAFALGRFDGEALYEHPDPRRGEHKDWGTYIFDFGRPQVRNFLVANASYWIEEFHIDGLRVDAVASMLYHDYSREDGEWYPNQFGGRENLEAVQLLQETNATVYRRYPGAVTIAEESTSWPGVTKPTYMGGLGFGLKWNMGWMHDTLGYVELPPIYRQYHHHQITFSMVYAYSENFCLPISHDEVVYGKGSMLRKMPGDRWEQLSNLRAYYAFMWAHPGKQLLFMGQEFGQESEWADSRSLDWWVTDQPLHAGLQKLVADLNALYTSRTPLWELDNDWEGFSWIDANDANGNTYSFLRFGKPDGRGDRPVIASVVNFSGMEHHQYRIGLPRPGVWREILNTDAAIYGGAGVGNLGEIVAEDVPWHGQPYSALVTMQKLSAVWFEPVADGEGESTLAATPGVARPELSRTPVIEEPGVRSELAEHELVDPRTGSDRAGIEGLS